jgi:hypothetical protein
MKIVFGVTTYGSVPRVDGLFKSFWNNIQDVSTAEHEITTVCVDDGTQDPQAVTQRMRTCKRFNFKYVLHSQNYGIPFSWNRIAEYIPDADLAVIFNDDIRFLAPGWLSRLIYFHTVNEDVGTVGLPLMNEPGFNDRDPRWEQTPGRVGCAVGCAFAVKPRDLFQIENPDGSRGFFEALISFHEELEAGFRLAQVGKLSYMVSYPPLYHQGGATFQSNPNLVWRKEHPLGPKDEFIAYVQKTPWFVEQYMPEYEKGNFDRMSYSRFLFTKKWGLLDEPRHQEIKGEMVDVIAEPQKPIHSRCVDIWPPREIKWLNRHGQEMTYLDA